MIRDFLKALKASSRGEKMKGALKVLITTTGRSKALTKYLSVREPVFADRDGAVNSGLGWDYTPNTLALVTRFAAIALVDGSSP